MHVIESIEAEDAYTAKLFKETFKEDPEAGKFYSDTKTESLQNAKLEFLKAFVKEDPEDFAIENFKEVVEKILMYFFQNYKRYIDIDEFARFLGGKTNLNVMSLYDCCREIPATKSSINAMKTSNDTQDMGM